MNNYVTFCDSSYCAFLFINLYSLSKQIKEKCNLIIYSLDKRLPLIINKWSLKNINIEIQYIDKIKDQRLNLMKENRPYKFYCWGLSPFVINDALKRLKQPIIYLDTDLIFNNDPNEYLGKRHEDINNKILLTPHFYENLSSSSARHGKFCIQFMRFSYNKSVLDIVSEWANRCYINSGIDLDNNVFGDQLYLDEWPDKYPDRVYIEENSSLFVGPWNTKSFLKEKTLMVHLHSAIPIKIINFIILISCGSGFKLSKDHKDFLKQTIKAIKLPIKNIDVSKLKVKRTIRSILISIYLQNPIFIKFSEK